MGTETDSEPSGEDAPIACTLSTTAAAGQALEWVDLQQRATGVTALDAGVRMTFPATMSDGVEDLVRRERSCCSFLTIKTSAIDEVLTVDILSSNPEALPVIEAMAGIGRA